jgi:formamidopyrimidine-DNA glycosylase
MKEMLSDAVLGPDALQISVEEFYERFRHLRREVKPALLDQRLVAGVGNLYASEILHAAKVHPQARCDELSKVLWKRIYEQMIKILQTAIAYEGSTLADGTYRNSLNQAGGYQNAHLVYDRAGLNCLSCANGTIVRIVQAQRSTFYCPECQRKR